MVEAKVENETGLSLGKISSFEFDFSKPEQKEGIAEAARGVFNALDEAHRTGKKISFRELIREGLKKVKQERETQQKQLPDATDNPRATDKD